MTCNSFYKSIYIHNLWTYTHECTQTNKLHLYGTRSLGWLSSSFARNIINNHVRNECIQPDIHNLIHLLLTWTINYSFIACFARNLKGFQNTRFFFFFFFFGILPTLFWLWIYTHIRTHTQSIENICDIRHKYFINPLSQRWVFYLRRTQLQN